MLVEHKPDVLKWIMQRVEVEKGGESEVEGEGVGGMITIVD
jgi:hypothetical protein